MFFGGGGGGGFPFGMDDEGEEGGFPGMGGMGGRRGPPKEVDNKQLYEIIGVDKTATMDQIKKAYRKLAIKNHPDKGGDEKKFQEIQGAYDILFDKEKREVYDKHGMEGLKGGGGGGGGMDDIFSMFMGGRGGGAAQKQKQRVKPIAKQVEISLADVYNGKTVTVDCDRQRICDACKGVGGSDATAVQSCTGCKGRGMRTVMRQMGPGMYSQSTGPCDECDGQGEIINLEKRCKTCKGKKVKRDKKKLTQVIDKGCPSAEQYHIHGEGDCVPDVEHGDVVIVVKVRNNKIFTRKGADLYMEKEISLLESLTGVDFTIMHLDGRIIRIQGEKGKVTKPASTMTCNDLGMPFHKTPYRFGNLFITFKVRFPDTMNQKQIGDVNKILPSKQSASEKSDLDDCKETVILSKFEEHHKNTHAQGGTRGNDSEEEGDEEGQPGGVGCQQQ